MSGTADYPFVRAFAFLVSEANHHRSRAEVTVTAASGVLPAGTLLKGASLQAKLTPCTDAAGLATLVGILGYSTDASGALDVDVTAIVRDAEVTDSYLILGAITLAEVEPALNKLGIALRRGDLPAPGGTFAIARNSDPKLASSIYGPTGIVDVNPVAMVAATSTTAGARVLGEEHVEGGISQEVPGGVVAVIPVDPPVAPPTAPSEGARSARDQREGEPPVVPATPTPTPPDAPSAGASRTDAPPPAGPETRRGGSR